MTIGIPKEIKIGEGRIAITPVAVAQLVRSGHQVYVAQGAGLKSGSTDQKFRRAGARMVNQKTAWAQSLILKVKEPTPSEYRYLRKGQILFSYLHLAGSPKKLTEQLLKKEVTAIAMETVEKNGILNLAAPMSEVAGRMAIEVGAWYLQQSQAGRGILLDKILGVDRTQIVVIGGGTAGRSAAESALARGACVDIFEIRQDRRQQLKKFFAKNRLLKIYNLDKKILASTLQHADVVVGAALIPGARSPQIVLREMVKKMKKGSVIVDIAIDQGGCFETSVAGTHDKPIKVIHGVTHYAVLNMPGAFPHSSTQALVHATAPYIQALAGKGMQALKKDRGFAKGLATYQGRLYSKPVGKYFGIKTFNFIT